MRHTLADPSVDDSVAQTRQAYRNVLARRGLVDFSQGEIDRALAMLRSEGHSHISPEDISFQASVVRLQSRKDLSPGAIEDALRELITAEYECDQAEWERDCHMSGVRDHAHFKLFSGTPRPMPMPRPD